MPMAAGGWWLRVAQAPGTTQGSADRSRLPAPVAVPPPRRSQSHHPPPSSPTLDRAHRHRGAVRQRGGSCDSLPRGSPVYQIGVLCCRAWSPLLFQAEVPACCHHAARYRTVGQALPAAPLPAPESTRHLRGCPVVVPGMSTTLAMQSTGRPPPPLGRCPLRLPRRSLPCRPVNSSVPPRRVRP